MHLSSVPGDRHQSALKSLLETFSFIRLQSIFVVLMTMDLPPRLWGATHTGRSENSSRSSCSGQEMHGLLVTNLERGLSLRLPRSDKQEQPKCIFGTSVLFGFAFKMRLNVVDCGHGKTSFYRYEISDTGS